MKRSALSRIIGPAYSGRGRNYGKLGDYAKQIADLKEVIRLKPDYDTDYIALAQAYDNKGEPDRAIAVLDKYLQKNPDNYQAHSVRAQMHISLGEIDEAIADTNELIRLKGNAEAYHARATAYAYKKDYDRAIADLTQAIRLDPDNEERAYFSRAGLFNRKGDYARAIADVSEFIRLSLARLSEPRLSEPSGEVLRKAMIGILVSGYSLRATYRLNMGDKENALADCNEAIRQWPDQAEAYSGRGRIYYWQRQYDLAIPDFDKALQLDPSEWMARSTKALALASPRQARCRQRGSSHRYFVPEKTRIVISPHEVKSPTSKENTVRLPTI